MYVYVHVCVCVCVCVLFAVDFKISHREKSGSELLWQKEENMLKAGNWAGSEIEPSGRGTAVGELGHLFKLLESI